MRVLEGEVARFEDDELWWTIVDLRHVFDATRQNQPEIEDTSAAEQSGHGRFAYQHRFVNVSCVSMLMDGHPQLVSNMAALQVGEVWQLLRIHRDAQKDEDGSIYSHSCHVYVVKVVWQLARCATCVCAARPVRPCAHVLWSRKDGTESAEASERRKDLKQEIA